ncbi:PHP domain-containing protein [uncultured Paraglaciecola sp.]|uniref:PHP domain-containing protein n=1 Tax=uncultured Paraglaciecola sp. TaxID=1765024 RepID=UPI0026071A45|nr:PHP domain-containing protein [uncultured Paraglaciecola sp.]
MFKKSFYIFIWIVIPTIVLTSYLIFTKEAAVVTPQALSSAEASQTRKLVKEILGEFASTQTFVDIRLQQSDIDAIAAVASHTIPASAFEARLSQFGLLVLASKEVSFFSTSMYVNFKCFLTPSFDKFEFDICYLGDLPIAGSIANWMLENVTFLLFGTEVQKTATTLLADAELQNGEIRFSAQKASDFSVKINESVSDVVKLATQFNSVDSVSPTRVTFYLTYLQGLPHESESLAFYMQKLFAYSMGFEQDFDRVAENSAIIWALAIHFSNPQFARAIGLEPDYKGKSNVATKIRGRADLSLHFLYSTVLEQIAESDIGLSIGELKEILDKGKGGTGFSFADLAADKAGLFFAKYSRQNEMLAKRVANVISTITDESAFFPLVHDLPEGLNEQNFSRVFGDLNSAEYAALELKIDQRIATALIYQNASKPVHITQPKVVSVNNAPRQWFKVDTHIHSRFSDGASDIMSIAEKAQQFGCAAIAITDHGDNDLPKVLSDSYFADISQAGVTFPKLTVMPGLEWNLPPFKGREHATVLLPKNRNLKRNLQTFRQRYDSYKLWQKSNYQAKDALQWLASHFISDVFKPVIFYNHPSRKVWQTAENMHDFTEWSQYDESVIGFSGAPGHQKKRGDDNGSYEFVQKTVHGWDPSIAIIGGEWDQLLRDGRRVFAARAASDFHNTKMDYWPCEFSSTHVKAKSNAHNDILNGFHSGDFWAQHGNFVKQVDFYLEVNGIKATPGDMLGVSEGAKLRVVLEVALNKADWQGYKTSLDEVELVIVESDNISSQKFLPERYYQNGKFKLVYDYNVSKTLAQFRWRGRSIQPEQHHYMFYTNPIAVRLTD